MARINKSEKPTHAAGWLMLLALSTGPTAVACSSDESSQGDALTDDDAALADDDAADDDGTATDDDGAAADDDGAATDDDAPDDDTSDDDGAATDDDAPDDDGPVADDDTGTDDDTTMDDDTSDDDGPVVDDDTADDDTADDDGPVADDDASSDDDLGDDDAADDDLGDDDAADDDDVVPDDDLGDDAGTDDDGGDPEDVWAACPASDTWNADASWPLTLSVGTDAVYCAMFSESRTLQEELASRIQLRFSPGDYALPENGEAAAPLPMCMRDANDAISSLTSGTVSTLLSGAGEDVRYSLSLDGVFDDALASTLQASVARTAASDASPAYLLDGSEPDTSEDALQDLLVCQDAEYCFPALLFTSCQYESGTPNLHRVELESGNIEFELRLGQSFAGTEPGAYVRASGSFAGQQFTQTNYFKLVYHPSHHHFERTFVVLFDEPIDGACGVEVTNLERFGDDIPDEAYTVDCELNQLDPIPVLSAELVFE